ncbi:DUF4365 domain-containing protein [Streptomyces mobaraensis NBRC 13819 = DSM 40847]|uniref:DUF4365 domain-containing protein n=1 Tax=Streptomyces mobaraensis (strain ATCC 29032 / DSM 40847 / JCM 4168 / NBRC 13819 / NCIMB 11159 / IPCR 16-22) TaxID=1223523 RepID=M3AWJ1_STRM1|nr:DUF4365 domain-containing protein [Streptomyces mobaraensis]EME97942.1 hypothetical protein H340_23928 [Streptomyces mobaraensis NBRC 13819 = DSM 40847]QTT74027.1 DUF4365 domain-containing protein [Streptomyces mobaraensis NBRC 13819 = DSM 40847]
MSHVPESRRVGRVAVNKLRSLLEQRGHIVQEIDGANDHGEDMLVTFVSNGQRTEDTVAIQVKGGSSHRTRRGYRVRVDQHASNWRNSNIPVLCVVHDPEPDTLYWANATRQLRRAAAQRKVLKSVVISRDTALTEGTLDDFVRQARRCVDLERRGIGRLSDMAGVEFGETDIVKPFRTDDVGEDMVFWQRKGEPFATLLHNDLDWAPVRISEDMLRFGPFFPHIGDVVLAEAEAHWLIACFKTSEWWRRPEST